MKKRINGFLEGLHVQALKLRPIHFGNPDQNLYDVGKIFFHHLRKDDVFERASAMAFNFTVAMFPLLLFLLNTIPFIQFFFPEVTTANILLFVRDILPDNIYDEAAPTIMDIVSKPRQSLLSLGFFLALYLSTNGVISMMNAFNAVYRTKEYRSFFRTRLIAVSIVFVLVLSICGAVLVMLVGSELLLRISEFEFVSNSIYYYSLAFFRFFVLLTLFMIATAYIFRFAPAVHDKWKFFSTGSVVAGFLITLGFFLFTFYLNNFNSYNKLYGSIGTMIAVMFWLWITSILVLIGFEINVSLDKAGSKKRPEKVLLKKEKNN
ncbi:YihY/virulence factor BrkB family protein [Cyclobacterium jeungdonense]|uniref:YihY/virulence factor BrkB family protein n=1 Tax=Cyclobacterium jeungdonense TaxID=708087 RepID=A0ABT8C8A6_9BACT|nr:YihY/virulence factor BrkB family protein [Cyclobacterium jeungdonense]MDN3688259.1 YihY/virulence factor BrkB family protein [Cyclobacterium jeungdonense]